MAEGDDGEKSLDPTQKHLDEALERGDVVKSQEVNSWFVMAGGTLMLMAFSGSMSSGIMTTLRGLIANSFDIPVDGPGFVDVIAKLGRGIRMAAHQVIDVGVGDLLVDEVAAGRHTNLTLMQERAERTGL